ncbi:MAG TPA: sensor domain-containing phosphodiesterase, partial [Clostridiaceae bacterium]|nr:sensor domain-containing phosphodiesterase [Clostridiaceae bacterium]
GYSTLARERELNVNTLKIDKSFIDKLMYLNPEDAITGDIISMAHRLGHNVVAEGVEHEKQRRYLEDNLCDLIQGYLISRPLDESSLCDMLGKEKAVNQTV